MKEQILTQERGSKALVLIPLNLDGFLFSGKWKSGKSEEVRSRMVGDFAAWRSDSMQLEIELSRLIKALRADGAARELPPEPKI
jgi:hypothetical protein